MDFLVEAHLPRLLVYRIRELGHDTLHTLDLPKRNQTSNVEINRISMRESRVVITKDADFVDSFLLSHQPFKLLLISTGNIKNSDLETLFRSAFPAITAAFDTYDHLELTRTALITHA